MVFDTLRARLSSLWHSSTDDSESDSSETTADADSSSAPDDETLSYAEEIEYGVDERDLPDEDKVLRLLVKRGGRVDQSTILDETGWSQDHLEDVIDRMETDDQISAITVGRKRVICRRGFEPKGYRSHLNE
ncbi:helix-turn-helix transcriptional regulator [Haloarchaeobius amylolyticus]|uniref:Helix-turn-helix transcriptional regulator n=1 Tax=Haloarchaeobius amylolyticus TaxID=1198296 RepID=A0ABD6BGQ1_9EURY